MAGMPQQVFEIGIKRAVEVVLKDKVGTTISIIENHETRKVESRQGSEWYKQIARLVAFNPLQQRCQLGDFAGVYFGDECEDSLRHSFPQSATYVTM